MFDLLTPSDRRKALSINALAMILLVLPCSSRALHGLKKDQPDVLTEVQELIDRVLLPANKSFYPIMELLSPSPETQLDTFELDSQNGKVVLAALTPR